MNDIELSECITAIDQRWPEQLNDVMAGDLRAALRCYDKQLAMEAIRQIRLESNYRVIPVGKIINACKKRNPNVSRSRSKVSVSWNIFFQAPKTGAFRQLHTSGNINRHRAVQVANQIRGKYGQDWVVVQDATLTDMVKSRHEIYLKK
jgi:hypothetical protein